MGAVVSTKELKDAKLDIDIIKSQLKPSQRNKISKESLEEIRKLSEDPDYGEEFLDCYIDNLNLLKENKKYTYDNYLKAVKFYCLIESGNNISNSYIKVFPERLKRLIDRGRPKEEIRGEASRYNNSKLVNEIRRVTGIPVNLIFRHTLYEAINTQAKLMRNAKSETVKQKAAECLIRELKPQEDTVLSIDVNDGTKSAIEELRKATEELTLAQKRSIESGVPIRNIIEGKIVNCENESE
jgi:hypothetical protein